MTAMKDGTFNNGVYNGTGRASLRLENMKIVLGYGGISYFISYRSKQLQLGNHLMLCVSECLLIK